MVTNLTDARASLPQLVISSAPVTGEATPSFFSPKSKSEPISNKSSPTVQVVALGRKSIMKKKDASPKKRVKIILTPLDKLALQNLQSSASPAPKVLSITSTTVTEALSALSLSSPKRVNHTPRFSLVQQSRPHSSLKPQLRTVSRVEIDRSDDKVRQMQEQEKVELQKRVQLAIKLQQAEEESMRLRVEEYEKQLYEKSIQSGVDAVILNLVALFRQEQQYLLKTSKMLAPTLTITYEEGEKSAIHECYFRVTEIQKKMNLELVKAFAQLGKKEHLFTTLNERVQKEVETNPRHLALYKSILLCERLQSAQALRSRLIQTYVMSYVQRL
jgi:hypothetical protein